MLKDKQYIYFTISIRGNGLKSRLLKSFRSIKKGKQPHKKIEKVFKQAVHTKEM